MRKRYIQTAVVIALASTSQTFAASQTPSSNTSSAGGLKPCSSVAVDPPTYVTLGKSTVVKLGFPAARMVVGGQSTSRTVSPTTPTSKDEKPTLSPVPQTTSDGVADVDITLLSPTDLFFLGKKSGSMNLVLQGTDGRCSIKDVIVTLDPNTLQAKLTELMPEETGIKIRGAENAVVLTGLVSDAVKLDQIINLATSYGDGKKVVNMLRVSDPQQVMLEVKIAEVSKSLLDRFGFDFSRLATSADGSKSKIISGIVGGGPAVFERYRPGLTFDLERTVPFDARVTGVNQASLFGMDAEKKDGLVRVLAEPNIMAISGQQASFLSGGKIFIPVAQNNMGGGTTITLEEKEFGVGLKFTPTVLDRSRVNLKLTSEVSELSQTGSPFTTINGATSILPSMATRRADTTVQLGDGQSFVVAGLIRNNVSETISRFPGVGEVPILGALFRSTEFQNDKTELVFVVTPRLVKPITTDVVLPTDNHVVPNRAEVLFLGKAEGVAKETTSEPSAPTK
ncbi:type II and III secretion system protein family protein [Herbaspirillum sp. GCM10030257]|uniref:type II and III secretion system protein family protein n=1 Tax=Herbaspirillum sp. GCM10030257 TaxID=3273393 RepID=UPI00360DFEAB